MIINPSNLISSCREFLMNIFPAGALFCLGYGNLAGWTAGQEAQKATAKKHKFQEDSGMSFQEVFEFAYGEFAHVMKYFGSEIGKDNLIEMLKRNGDENAKQL